LLHSLRIRLLVSTLVWSVSATFSSALVAGQKVDIYSAEALVKNQSEKERNAAARASIGGLVVRVSGQRGALDNPAVKAALPKAQNYLFGFSYKSSAERITEKGKTYTAVGLQLNYEPKAIEQLLREAQLPLWPAVRPKLLIWLVAKDQTGLHLVPELVDSQALQAQAKYRGLPISRPTLDLEDSISLSADDLWSLNLEKIKAASIRYNPDAILIGRYTPYSLGPIPPAAVVDELAIEDESNSTVETGLAASSAASSLVVTDMESDIAAEQPQGPWVGDWLLIHADTEQFFADEAPEVKDLFGLAIDRAADQFASQYAIVTTDAGPQAIVVRISGITSFSAFKDVQAYLDELALVQRVELIKVNAEGMLVRLTTEGGVTLLMNTLALGHRLAPLVSETIAELPSSVATVDTAPVLAPVVGEAADLDAETMAELDEALAGELSAVDTATEQLPETDIAPHGGTLDNPLMYVWQK
jgi:uncharacterized protein